MNDTEAVEEKNITPCARMNMWVGDQIGTIDRVINSSLGRETEEHQSYLLGVTAGIRMLRDEWLKGSFSK